MTATEEKLFSDTTIEVPVYFSQTQLSLLLITEGGYLPSALLSGSQFPLSNYSMCSKAIQKQH